MGVFKELSQGGGYSLPYLLHIRDARGDIYLVNDTKDLTYEGITYKASTFNYSPSDGGEAGLEVELQDAGSGIINVLESNYALDVSVTGLFLEGGDVFEIKRWTHRYGTATWDGKGLKINFNSEDRMGMTFPGLIFNSYNNRGLSR